MDGARANPIERDPPIMRISEVGGNPFCSREQHHPHVGSPTDRVTEGGLEEERCMELNDEVEQVLHELSGVDP